MAMKIKFVMPSRKARVLWVPAILAVLVLAGCPSTNRPPPNPAPPPEPGYEPPPPPKASRPFRRAAFRGKAFCPKGSFFDPRRGGECWTCQGRTRTALPVDSLKACVGQRRKLESPAARGKRTKLAWQCKGPWFWDAWRGGYCWRCPKGYKRSVSHINAKSACTRTLKRRFYRAQFVTKFGCRRNQFFDPRRGGQCWTCPPGYRRTARPVTSARACRRS